jgi:hypothetical protein
LHTFCAAGFSSSSKPRDTSEILDCLQCFVKGMQLLAKLLSARKRARDWKQQEYSSRVATVLAAATAVLQHPSLYVTASAGGKMCVRMLGDTQLMSLVATAQQEVAQLLLAHTQQQQQQPGDQQQQSHTLLLSVAQQLLLWWCEASKLWSLHPDRSKHVEAATAAAADGYWAYQLQVVELASAVLQAAGHNCTSEQFLVLVKVGACPCMGTVGLPNVRHARV